MRKLAAALLVFSVACTSDDPDLTDTDATGTSDDSGDGDPGDGDGDPGDGDGEPGDGDGEPEPPPVPTELPSVNGPCPDFVTGDVEFAPAGTETRTVKLWVGDQPQPLEQPGGMLVIYWHAFGSQPAEAAYTLSQVVIDAITAAGGVVAAPYPGSEVGQFPWYYVNGDDRDDDMLLADEIVACAIAEVGVDPRRIHATGMSAGGLQTTAMAMRRSRYVASVTTFSGGVLAALDFEDPSNHFAAMILHGGANDVFGGVVQFDQLSTQWFNQLRGNGNFAFMCDHGMGHNIPAGFGPDVANFFYAHPFGTEPSPYAAGLPTELPDYCALP